MPRPIIRLAAGVLLLLGLAAFVGVSTAKAEETDQAAYCVRGHQTFVTDDAELQNTLDLAVEFSGGIYSIVMAYDEEEDPGHLNPIPTGEALDPNTPFEALIDQDNDYIFSYVTSPEAEFNPLFTPIAEGACAAAAESPAASAPEASRIAYCSVSGNTMPNGAPLAPGTFLNLLAGQPASDKHYTGAVPAWYVQGVGLTCELTPAQAALAAASTQKAGGGGDLEIPIPGVTDYAVYTYVPAK